METKPRNRKSLFWPLLLIALGGALFVNNTHLAGDTFWDTLLNLWPLLLIVGGLDSIFRREGFVGPVLLIGVGVVILMGNFGYPVVEHWGALLRLWPVLLIAWGLDLLVGQRSFWSLIVGLGLGVALLAGVLWLASSGTTIGDSGLKGETIEQTLEGATNAEVTLNIPTGLLEVRGGTSSGQLVRGSARIAKTETLAQEYTVTGKHGKYSLGSQGFFYTTPFYWGEADTGWQLQLNSQLPLELISKMAVGEQRLWLNGLNLQTLEAKTVIGRTIVALPQKTIALVNLSNVIGEVVIYVPRDADVQIEMDTALTVVRIAPGFQRRENYIFTSPEISAAHHIRVENVIGVIRVLFMP
jgi:hypothetical protein